MILRINHSFILLILLQSSALPQDSPAAWLISSQDSRRMPREAAETAAAQPQAKLATFPDVFSGSVDAQRMAISGVVHAATRAPGAGAQSAPWWTVQRLRLALSLAALVFVAAIFWIWALRVLLRRQRAKLHDALLAHRNSEMEFTCTQRERIRLAHDLHDGFQQLLASASYRLDAALRHMPDSPGKAVEEMRGAQSALMHTQSQLRDAMWGLTQVAEGSPGFTALLRQAAQHMAHWRDCVVLSSEGSEREMTDHLMGSLLMIVQEAVGNAIKHGNAVRVEVEARFDEHGITLTIHDNGNGFDPANAATVNDGHFGIRGMKERMRWLGGTLDVTSGEGQGTTVKAFITWAKANASDKDNPARRTRTAHIA